MKSWIIGLLLSIPGSQAQVSFSQPDYYRFIGSAYIAKTAACTPARTNTALGAFTADTDCPGPTVEFNPGPGTIQTTDTNLPKFTVNSLPAGTYKVTIQVSAILSQVAYADMAINDGTTTSGQQHGDDTVTHPYTLVGIFKYTTGANQTFSVFGSASSGSITIDLVNGNPRILFLIEKIGP